MDNLPINNIVEIYASNFAIRHKYHTRENTRILRELSDGFYTWYIKNKLHHIRNMENDLKEIRKHLQFEILTFDELFGQYLLKYYNITI